MLEKNENQVLNLLKFIPIFIFLVLITTIYIIIDNNNSNFNKLLTKLEEESIYKEKLLIKREVERAYNSIDLENKQKRENIKRYIKQRVYEAHTIMDSIYKENQDKSKDEIIKIINETLRNIRFNENRGYYFIFNMEGKLVLHPIFKHLEEENLKDLTDVRGGYFVRRFTEIAEKSGEGFSTWWWHKEKEDKEQYEKIGFVKIFKPLNVYIATGEYVKDYEKVLKRELVRKINQIRFGENGYLFILDKKGTLLSHINKKNIGTGLDNKDKNLVANIKRFLDVIKNGRKEDYISYNNLKPNSNKLTEKTSYFKVFKYWDWTIGAGFYIDDIKKEFLYKKQSLEKDNQDKLKKIIFISFIIFSFFILLFFYFSKEIKNKFLTYKKIVKNKNDELLELNNNLEEKVKDRTIKLEEQKNLVEIFINSIPDIVWMKDVNGTYLHCNKRFTQFFGASIDEIVGKTDYDFVDKELADFFVKHDRKAMASNKPLSNYENIPFANDGHEEYTKTVKTAIRDHNGKVIGSLGIGRDFTKEKEQQEELARTNEELEDSNEELQTMIYNLKTTQDKLIESEKMASLGSLVAGVAHEINTPVGICLTASSHLSFSLEILKEKYENKEMSEKEFEEYVKEADEITKLILSNIERTSDLVKNFKQIAVDQTNEEKRTFNLKEYTTGLLFSLQNIIKKKDIKIDVNCADDLSINSYPGLYSQILTNLIINSFKHGFREKDKGNININVSEKDDKIILIYKDDGEGIKKENLNKIFDPFFTTNRKNGGTGLGLNIIYNIITNTLKGNIDCKSEENEGVEFIITFNM